MSLISERKLATSSSFKDPNFLILKILKNGDVYSPCKHKSFIEFLEAIT